MPGIQQPPITVPMPEPDLVVEVPDSPIGGELDGIEQPRGPSRDAEETLDMDPAEVTGDPEDDLGGEAGE